MQRARPVRPEQHGLLDVAGARWPGDEVQQSWHVTSAIFAPEAGNHRFKITGNVLRVNDDDVVIGHEVDGGRIVLARRQGDRARFRDGGK